MVKYKKCPRCELNYIEEDKDFCDVCLAEMQGGKLKFADLDEDEDSDKTELCPVCGENFMRPGEKMCDECKKNAEYELEGEGIDQGDDFTDDFEDDFTDDYVEEESSTTEEAPMDDLDYDPAADFGGLDDEDDDDDDEDDEDEDDDF